MARLAVVVLTCERYWSTRVPWQRATSLRDEAPEDLFYLGHRAEPRERLFWWGAPDNYAAAP